MGDTPTTKEKTSTASSGAAQKRRRGFGLQAIAKTLPKVTGKALGRRGFAEADLLADWARIAGTDIAAHCVPRKLERPRPGRKGEGVLTLRVEAGFALELQHLEPLILERINGHFGYRAVGRLRMIQSPLPGAPERAKDAEEEAVPADPESEADLKTRLAAVGDEDLRDALDRFGHALLRRGG